MIKQLLSTVAACSAVAIGGSSFAAVSTDEAAKLKTTLTPLGAEKSGNKEGTIPEWTGGYKATGPKYKSGPRPDPFPGEKPVLSITAKNMDQYADKLSEGTKALLKKYPDTYRLDVYPTHRTASAPQWVYDNTFKNATRAKTTHEGNSVEGAYGGIPFPIPKTGNEVMWNHQLAWQGEGYEWALRSWTVTSSGQLILSTAADEWHQYPYYYKDGSAEKIGGGDFWYGTQTASAPPFRAGELTLVRDPLDMGGRGRQAWQYLPGQRRVRKAPSINYDNPDTITSSGVSNMDESFMFMGPQDRYTWKLVGKKEMYIPYNNNRLGSAKIADVIGPKHVNPDLKRWELHRVWIVEANLAPGKRHVVPKKRYYFDEDSWFAVLGEGYDAQGALWKAQYSTMLLIPELPGIIGSVNWGLYNLLTGAYLYDASLNELPYQLRVLEGSQLKPESFFTPDGLVERGVR